MYLILDCEGNCVGMVTASGVIGSNIAEVLIDNHYVLVNTEMLNLRNEEEEG